MTVDEAFRLVQDCKDAGWEIVPVTESEFSEIKSWMIGPSAAMWRANPLLLGLPLVIT